MAISDKFKKSESLFSTTLSASISTGTGETITPASVVGLPTDTEITLTVDRVDINGNATPAKLERITGTISGGNLTSYTRGTDGTTEQAHASGAVVEYIWNSQDWNDLVDGLLVNHGQDGEHNFANGDALKDDNDNELVKFGLTASAVNEVTVTNAATGNAPAISATGGDTNIDLKLKGKGTGHLQAYDNESASYFDVVPNSSMSRQAIMNGNFDVWQRGTSLVISTSGAITDRFLISGSADGGTLPTLTHARAALTPGDIPNAFFYYKLSTNGAGTSLGVGARYQMYQRIEHGTRNLCGLNKKVTVSFWAKSSIADKRLGLSLTQSYGTGGSPSTGEAINGTNWTLTSTWTKYTHTFTTNTLVGKTFGTAFDDFLQLEFNHIWGTTYDSISGASTDEDFGGAGDIDIAQVQLCAGEVALPFQPKSYAQELADCQRYCYVPKTDGTYSLIGGTGFAGSTTVCRLTLPFPVEMRTSPALTATATDYVLTPDHSATIDLTDISLGATTVNRSCAMISATVAAGLTQYRTYQLLTDGTANRLMIFSAEL